MKDKKKYVCKCIYLIQLYKKSCGPGLCNLVINPIQSAELEDKAVIVVPNLLLFIVPYYLEMEVSGDETDLHLIRN